MDDQTATILRIVLRISALLVSVSLVLWIGFPAYRSLIGGYILGLIFSMLNGWYLAMKLKQVALVAVEAKGKRVATGFMMRAVISVLAVMIAVKRDGFDVLTTIIGLFTVNLIMVVAGIVLMLKHNKAEKQ